MRRVTPTYLSDRIPVITPDQSAAFAAGLQKIGLVDGEGWLLAEPAVTGAGKVGVAAGGGGYSLREQRRRVARGQQLAGQGACWRRAARVSACAVLAPSVGGNLRCFLPPGNHHHCYLVRNARPTSVEHPRFRRALPRFAAPQRARFADYGTSLLASSPTVQNTSAPNYRWVPRLQRELPWLRPRSRTLSLAYRTSLVIQALNVAYARHDAVAGGQRQLGVQEGGGGGDTMPAVDAWREASCDVRRPTRHCCSAWTTTTGAAPPPPCCRLPDRLPGVARGGGRGQPDAAGGAARGARWQAQRANHPRL